MAWPVPARGPGKQALTRARGPGSSLGALGLGLARASVGSVAHHVSDYFTFNSAKRKQQKLSPVRNFGSLAPVRLQEAGAGRQQ